MERLLMACRLTSKPESEIEQLFDGSSELIFFVKRIEHYSFRPIDGLHAGGLERISLPVHDRERWMQYYRALPEESDSLLKLIREKYRIDYVLLTEPTVQLRRLPR
jgi:hypothetical protein